MKCKNCGQEFEGKFCPKCGNPASSVNSGANENSSEVSSIFTGGIIAFFFIDIALILVSIISLGLAYPLIRCFKEKWIADHTILDDRKIEFDGNGGQLFGKYIIWLLLSLITLGIYWLLKGSILLRGWVAKHTHFVDSETGEEQKNLSTFNGKWYQLLGVKLITNFVKLITIGLGSFWAHCYTEKWFCKHQKIDGERLTFDGTGMQYFCKRIIWLLLTLVTLGIYSLWLKRNSKRWTVKHTHIVGSKKNTVEATQKNTVEITQKNNDNDDIKPLEDRKVYDATKENIKNVSPSIAYTISIHDSVTAIEREAFKGYSVKNIILPDSITRIGDYAFQNCGLLIDVRISASLTDLGYGIFENCISLKTIKIPDGVVSIGYSAFYNCSTLSEVSFPVSLTNIGYYSFAGCNSLTSINFKGTKAQWNSIEKGKGWNSNTGDYVIHCTDGDIAKS